MSLTARYAIADPIFKTALAEPDRVAILSPDFTVTYQELARFIATFARRLQLRGITQSSLLALSLVDDVSIICSAIAASIIGCRWIRMSEKLADLEQKIQPTHVLHDNYKHNIDRGNIICVGPWQFNADVEPKILDSYEFQGYSNFNNIYRISTSSGSTGVPKFIGVTLKYVLRQIEYFNSICSKPNASLGILFIDTLRIDMVCSAICNSGTAILNFDMDFLAEHCPDLVLGSPAQIAALFQNRRDIQYGKLPRALIAGGPLNTAHASLALEHFETVINGMGATEVGHVASNYVTSLEAPFSVGAPLSDTEIEIVDEFNNPLPTGVEGIVRMKTPVMADQYLFDLENVSSDIFRSGWFYSGDVGYRNADGELFITGRVRDTLNLGGFKLSAQMIDDQLMSVEGVADCVAFSEIDETLIMSLSVILVPKPGYSEDRIIKIMLNTYVPKASPQHIPARVYFTQNVPRNANGKAMRHKAVEAVNGVEPVRFKDLLPKRVN